MSDKLVTDICKRCLNKGIDNYCSVQLPQHKKITSFSKR